MWAVWPFERPALRDASITFLPRHGLTSIISGGSVAGTAGEALRLRFAERSNLAEGKVIARGG